MKNADATAPTLVVEARQLEDVTARLASEAVIAVDTESNSLYAYQERVCLIQLSVPDADYLVDPLAIRDLSPLHPLFADPEIEKVFHAAEYDLIGLWRDFGFDFANLFDTMVAARILGRSAVGLGSLLKSEFGFHHAKRHQRANWGKRPLPDHLLEYARLDTHFLIPLRHRFYEALQASGRWDLASEDFARACRVKSPANNARGPECWRISGAYELSGQQAAVLQELCRYRRQVAERMDRPLFKILRDDTLLNIARQTPKSGRDLSEVPGLRPRQIRKHREGLLAAVDRGLKGRPLRPPANHRPSEDFLERFDKLRKWRKSRARRMGVESDVVLPRDLLFAVARGAPRRRAELAKILDEVPARMRRFGDGILAVLSRVQNKVRSR